MKVSLSDVIATAALLVSLFVLYQTREANSPRIAVTPVVVPPYPVCSRRHEGFQIRSILRFNIANLGGRATSLERIVATESTPPVVVAIGDGQKFDPWYSLSKIEDPSDLLIQSNVYPWQAEPLIAKGTDLRLSENKFFNESPALLNLPIEPGKSITLNLSLTTLSWEPEGQVRQVTVALLAKFSHGETAILRATYQPPRMGRNSCAEQ